MKKRLLKKGTAYILTMAFTMSQAAMPVFEFNAYGATVQSDEEEQKELGGYLIADDSEEPTTATPETSPVESTSAEDETRESSTESSGADDETTESSAESSGADDETTESSTESSSTDDETTESSTESSGADDETKESSAESSPAAGNGLNTQNPTETPLAFSSARSLSLDPGIYVIAGGGLDKYDSMDKAIENAITSAEDGEMTIVISGKQTWKNTAETWEGEDFKLNIIGEESEIEPPVLTLASDMQLNGNTYIGDLTLESSTSRNIFANGHDLEINVSNEKHVQLTVYGGASEKAVENTSVTLTSGNILHVYGGGKGSKANRADVLGSTNVIIGKEANVAQNVVGGSNDGTVGGDSTVLLEGTSGASNKYYLTAGGISESGAPAYVNGKSTVTVESGAKTNAHIYGNFGGQDPATLAGDSLGTAVEITINGEATNSVIGGIGVSNIDNTQGINGDIEITVSETGKITRNIFGGNWASAVSSNPTATAPISGNVTINVFGQIGSAIYGGGSNCSQVNGDVYVTMHPGSICGSAVYGGPSGRGIVKGNTYVDSYTKKANYLYGGGLGEYKTVVEGDTNVTLRKNAYAYLIGGSSVNSAVSTTDPEAAKDLLPRVLGNVNITMEKGSSANFIIGGSHTGHTFTYGGEESVTMNIDGASVGTIYADGYKDLVPIQGECLINVTGKSTINSIYGSYEKAINYANLTERGSESVRVILNNAECTVNKIYYDIDEISLTDSTLTVVPVNTSDLTEEDYQQLIEVMDVNMTGTSTLALSRNAVITGDYTSLDSSNATLSLLAGKKLIIEGNYSGNTRLKIVENETSSAALSQVYAVAQGDISGNITWNDTANPVRFGLEGNEVIFGNPENANLTSDELTEFTGQGDASKKWWLVAKTDTPVETTPVETTPEETTSEETTPEETTPEETTPKETTSEETQPTPDFGGGSGGGGGGGGRPNINTPDVPAGPGTVIADPEVPLAGLPEIPVTDNLTIDDGEVPLAALPKTGTRSANGTLLFGSLTLLLTALFFNGKKKNNR